ncbi:MAG TPA: DNA methyltransferase [Sphingomicrobium sp.]
MRLQWSEIRARAAAFADRHKGDRYEKGETQTFYNEFFDVFGISRRQVATYEQRVRNLPGDKQGFIDLFWPATLIVEQKSAGLDLRKASNQALDYYDWLPEAQRPRFILTCDFQRWHLLDLNEGREWRFGLAELKDYIHAFSFMVGVTPRLHRKQSPANVKASQLMGQLHEQLAATGFAGHDLELLLVRLLFILFADDTGIFNNKDQFHSFIEDRTAADGSDLGRWLAELFGVLNTPEDRRQTTLDGELSDFPYINGELFAEHTGMPAFNMAMRTILLDACEFDWSEVSPAIFGGLFESVIDKVTRRRKGAHYTPEEAILKLIGPLFLDELQAELERARNLRSGRDNALAALHDRLAGLTFFDPACGAGNFLVVAYRELRELERELIKERYLRPGAKRDPGVPAAKLTRLGVGQFFGIEIDEFPARIAQVALWMTDHIANRHLSEDFGENIPSIPLTAAPGIRHGDALEVDWNDVLLAERCAYVLGNPPFVGAKMQSPHQRAQVRQLAQLGGSGGTLDYVAAWFIKAGAYAGLAIERGGSAPHVAFVATNSICQGEQVAQLWPILFHRHRMEIAFAHRTFVWPGKAAVHCVIVGMTRAEQCASETRLFTYVDAKEQPVETIQPALTAYLFAAPNDKHLVVKASKKAISPRLRLLSGSQPIDYEKYVMNPLERTKLIATAPESAAFLRPYMGAEEYINGGCNWVLELSSATPGEIRASKSLSDRVKAVRDSRLSSSRVQTRKAASTPHLFALAVIPSQAYFVIPKVSSERREYVPQGWLVPPTIPSDLLYVLEDATLWHFGLLTSSMHMAWLRQIGGRLKSDYRYSIGLVYNTFPWPEATSAQQARIEALAQVVLDARARPRNATSSLADMYDPDFMPAELRKAHRELDLAVDRLYRAKPFGSDRERVEHLFPLYEALVQPTTGAARINRKTVRRAARQSKAASEQI